MLQRTARPGTASARIVDGPLVSVIVPVRNGAGTLELVLQGLVEQSYSNLQILISDNGSTDETAEICQRFEARDSRVIYQRQRTVLPALENFRFWLPRARGKYVIFAAHDDLRDREVVAVLVSRAEACGAVCVMPAIWAFNRYGTSPFQVEDPRPLSMTEYPTAGKAITQRLRYIIHNGFPVYGLLRRDVLQSYHWREIDYGPELPLCVWLATVGEIEVCEQVRFYYWTPEVPRDAESRARQNSLKRLAPFPELRLAWLAALSAQRAWAGKGRRLPRVVAFAILYYWRRWPPFWHWVWRHTPVPLREGWREFKRRRGWRLN